MAKKGGCQAAALPGIYYEKKFIQKNSNALSYSFIIWSRNEWNMLFNLTFFKENLNKM